MTNKPKGQKSSATAFNVVDSSGWLEYTDDGSNADFFEPAIINADNLIVPTVSLLEVFKKVMREKGEEKALNLVGQMRQGTVVSLSADLALEAARLGTELKLPIADSIILATARSRKAILWTQDEDFKGLDGVRYIKK